MAIFAAHVWDTRNGRFSPQATHNKNGPSRIIRTTVLHSLHILTFSCDVGLTYAAPFHWECFLFSYGQLVKDRRKCSYKSPLIWKRERKSGIMKSSFWLLSFVSSFYFFVFFTQSDFQFLINIELTKKLLTFNDFCHLVGPSLLLFEHLSISTYLSCE